MLVVVFAFQVTYKEQLTRGYRLCCRLFHFQDKKRRNRHHPCSLSPIWFRREVSREKKQMHEGCFVRNIALYVCLVCVRLQLLLLRPVTFGGLSGSKLNVKVKAMFLRKWLVNWSERSHRAKENRLKETRPSRNISNENRDVQMQIQSDFCQLGVKDLE